MLSVTIELNKVIGCKAFNKQNILCKESIMLSNQEFMFIGMQTSRQYLLRSFANVYKMFAL
jgi:hypothetical protein